MYIYFEEKHRKTVDNLFRYQHDMNDNIIFNLLDKLGIEKPTSLSLEYRRTLLYFRYIEVITWPRGDKEFLFEC